MLNSRINANILLVILLMKLIYKKHFFRISGLIIKKSKSVTVVCWLYFILGFGHFSLEIKWLHN